MRYFLLILILLTGCSSVIGPFEIESITDGDTVRLVNGERIRFEGIDTPEISKKECFALEAKEFTRSLLEGQSIFLEGESVDNYKRLVRTVYLGDLNVNEIIVVNGYAEVPSRYKENVSHYSKLKELESYARFNCLGLWNCEECVVREFEVKSYEELIIPMVIVVLILGLIFYFIKDKLSV
jgi:micrococcal nuclease